MGCTDQVQMPSLLSRLRRKPAASAPPAKPAARSVQIEWRCEDGELVRQDAQIQADNRFLVACVSAQPPEGRLARVLEESSSYPVEVISAAACEGGYEIVMDFLWEGRRRQQRTDANGSATLVPNGRAAVPVEVVNVSSAGMKLFSIQPVEEGSPARIIGSSDSYICFVRYCAPTRQGYYIGIQFYGEGR